MFVRNGYLLSLIYTLLSFALQMLSPLFLQYLESKNAVYHLFPPSFPFLFPTLPSYTFPLLLLLLCENCNLYCLCEEIQCKILAKGPLHHDTAKANWCFIHFAYSYICHVGVSYFIEVVSKRKEKLHTCNQRFIKTFTFHIR